MYRQIKKDYIKHGSSVMNPALWAVLNYRFGRWASHLIFSPFRWFFGKCYGFNLFIILITSGIRLYRETEIGEDIHLIHSGNIQIHPSTIIGDRCGIHQDVTIGTNMSNETPVIGNDVYIGAGAKILGGINIGNNAIIAANSLVITDVPADHMAMGVPARIWKQKEQV